MQEESSHWAGSGLQLWLLAAAALLLLAAGIWCATRLVGWGWPRLIGARDWLVKWARPKRSNPAAVVVVSLLDPARPESTGLLVAALLVLGGGWAFFGLLEDVLENDPLVLLDLAVFSTLQSWRTGWLDHAMVAITELGSAPVIVPVVLAVGLLLAIKRCWHTLAYWVATILFGRALVWVLKSSVQRTRPNETLYSGMVERFSFPSGHAASSVVLYGFLAFLLARGRPCAHCIAIGIAAATIIGLTSFSRLYLGAHWMSDVLGSLALGTAWVALASVAFSLHAAAVPQRALAVTTLATLVIAGTVYVASQHAIAMQRYAVQQPAPLVELAGWRTGGWRSLPTHRIDLEREPAQSMSLQWAASASSVQQALGAAGWQPAALLGPGSLLAMLAPQPDMTQLPLRPEFHDGVLPALRFVHVAAPGERLVLRLWSTAHAVAASNANAGAALVPLWIGSVERQTLHRLGGLASWAGAVEAPPPLEALRGTLAGRSESAVRVEPMPDRALLLLQ